MSIVSIFNVECITYMLSKSCYLKIHHDFDTVFVRVSLADDFASSSSMFLVVLMSEACIISDLPDSSTLSINFDIGTFKKDFDAVLFVLRKLNS
jgi:hypothetical protein